jgi:hypothetical protein
MAAIGLVDRCSLAPERVAGGFLVSARLAARTAGLSLAASSRGR